jgi:hypothetical protein
MLMLFPIYGSHREVEPPSQRLESSREFGAEVGQRTSPSFADPRPAQAGV